MGRRRVPLPPVGSRVRWKRKEGVVVWHQPPDLIRGDPEQRILDVAIADMRFRGLEPNGWFPRGMTPKSVVEVDNPRCLVRLDDPRWGTGEEVWLWVTPYNLTLNKE